MCLLLQQLQQFLKLVSSEAICFRVQVQCRCVVASCARELHFRGCLNSKAAMTEGGCNADYGPDAHDIDLGVCSFKNLMAIDDAQSGL